MASWLTIVKENHYKKGVLDLHGLDYCSAKRLVQHLLQEKESAQLKTIIFGAGTHSKAAQKEGMRRLVSDALADKGIEASWKAGCVTLVEKSLLKKESHTFFKKEPGTLNVAAPLFVPRK